MNPIQNVLIIKGYGPPHEDRWQTHEAKLANDHRLNVVYPQDIPDFIDNAQPSVETFRAFITEIIEQKRLEPEKTLVLAHSLGGNGWLHILKKRTDLRKCFMRIICTPRDNKTGVDEISDFFPTPKIQLNEQERERVLVVGSDNDYVLNEHPSVLASHLSVAHHVIPNAGHFMPKALHQKDDVKDLGKEWVKIRHYLGLPY